MATIVEQLTESITSAVRKFFPQLVAEELKKLDTDSIGQSKPSRRDQIISLHEQGKRNSEISRALGTQPSYVSKVLSDHRRGLTKVGMLTMSEALAKYGTRTAAAKALDLPRQTFSDRLAKERVS